MEAYNKKGGQLCYLLETFGVTVIISSLDLNY